jgi:hypothetical protein
MSEPLAAARPDFFGKDNFCPFLGQVEDVNDPNRSGRVKVRCIGWHPFNRGETTEGGSGEDALATEDLPWARVGMPVTHAQQARVGGKHGLLVGSWVMGFFVDGEEAQDPFVLCSFNHTAKVSQADNRKDEAGTDGTLPNETKGFSKLAVAENVNNISRKTTEEQGGGGTSATADPAGDTILNDETDNSCGDLKSVASKRRMEESQMKKNSSDGSPENQKQSVNVADGRCGRPKHAMTDTMKVIMENMPSQYSRFAYGDKVWEVITGNNINLNGTFNQMAQQISGFMKGPILSAYQLIEELVNRNTRSATLLAIPDEVGDLRIVADKAKNVADDAQKVAFAIFPLGAGLFQAILKLLQELDNLGLETLGENLTGLIGAGANTGISNTSARCIAESLIESIEALTNIQIENSQAAGDEIFKLLMEGGGLDDFLNVLSGAMGAAGAIGSVIELFLTIESFATNPKVFHAGGAGTQDQRNVQGCTPERIYKTDQGYLPTLPSIGGGSGGFGGIPGIGGLITDGIGFGGLDIIANPVINTIPCEDAQTQFFPDDPTDPRFPDPNDDGGYGDDFLEGDFDPNRPTRIEGIDIDGPRIVQIRKKTRYVADVSMEDESYASFNRYYWSVTPEEPLITNASREEMSSDIYVQFSNPGRYTLKVRVENDRAQNAPVTKTFRVQARIKDRMRDPEILPGINTYPNGKFAELKAISEPSSDPQAAENFILGVPNQVVVLNPGKNYHFRNDVNPENAFPTFFVRGYQGTPIPVIDKNTGEFVALLTAPVSFSENHPKVPITVIPDNNDVGILSQDPDFDIELGGFYIQNTGRGYSLPSINIIDKDTGTENGEVEPVVVDGRIVDVIIKNSGRNFKRIPRIEIIDNGKSKLLKEIESEMEKRGLLSNVRNKGDKPR